MFCQTCIHDGVTARVAHPMQVAWLTARMDDTHPGATVCVGGHYAVRGTWTREQAEAYAKTGPRFWFSGSDARSAE